MRNELLCVTIGLAAGYYIAKARLESNFAEELDKETVAARDHYRDFYETKKRELDVLTKLTDPLVKKTVMEAFVTATPEDDSKLQEELAEFQETVSEASVALKNYQAFSESAAETTDEEEEETETPERDETVPPYIEEEIEYLEGMRVITSDFNNDTSPETVEEEPDADRPYIITQEDFFDEGQDNQYSITWYEGDSILAGQSDKEIPETSVDLMIGKKHLSMFGTKTEDPNAVYIRNEVSGSDYEITRHPGKYREVVLGESG